MSFDGIVKIIENSFKTLFILCGYPYAGKSYMVSQLESQTNIQIVSIDAIFKAREFDWDTNILPNTKEWQEIFNESYEITKVALEHGKTVLYDSTNQTVASRDALREVADSVGATSRVLYIKTPIETIWQRWEENQNNPKRSVVSRELVQQTINMFEEPTGAENVIIIQN